MRRSFDALALQTRQLLGEDPDGGGLFVFVGKSKTRVKLLWFDRNCYCLLYKRLHRALFAVPSATDGQPSVRIDANELAALFAGVPKGIARRNRQ